MNYYAKEVRYEDDVYRTAGVKARDDVSEILRCAGWKEVLIRDRQDQRKNAGKIQKALYHKIIANEWLHALHSLGAGDVLLIQFPVISHSMLLYRALRNVQKKGVKIYLLIHDLESFRGVKRDGGLSKKNIRTAFEEKTILKQSDRVIVHNHKMAAAILEFGVDAKKVHSLEIFDYLIPDKADQVDLVDRLGKEKPFVVAGNLMPKKAAYLYRIREQIPFNLYGVNYEETSNPAFHYQGSFDPNELPGKLSGSFGLVWDGTSPDTCTGAYGEYLKINNPHKTSLYLASGIPVAIWENAALADFVTEHQCGIVGKSIPELYQKIRELSEEEYETLCANTLRLSKQLRNGEFLKRVIS